MSHMQISHDHLWRDRSFVLFWLGRAVSLLGTAITSVVLPILVYRLTGSAFQTSLLATFEVVPYLVFGLVAGAFADRVNRRWLIMAIGVALSGSIGLFSPLRERTMTRDLAL